MMDLFYKGGPIFMSILSLILVVILSASAFVLFSIFYTRAGRLDKRFKGIELIKSLGLLALVIGLLGQLIGLFSAFRAVKMGEVESTSTLFAEGFKVSMVSSIYGVVIFGFTMVVWWGFKEKSTKPLK